MNKSFFPTAIITSILLLSGILIYQTKANIESQLSSISEVIYVIVIISLNAFNIIIGKKRNKDSKKGLPDEDEFSKKIIEKALARSFYMSLFSWLIVLFLHIKTSLQVEILFGYGFISMAIIFVTNWLILNKSGIKD